MSSVSSNSPSAAATAATSASSPASVSSSSPPATRFQSRLRKEFTALSTKNANSDILQVAIEQQSAAADSSSHTNSSSSSSSSIPLDYSCWLLQLRGPADSPYRNGVFSISFKFPADYPMKPPDIRFRTRIYHPNIAVTDESTRGQICPEAILKDWSPTIHVSDLIQRISLLLIAPSESSPLEPAILAEWMNERKKFIEIAETWTKKYANSGK